MLEGHISKAFDAGLAALHIRVLEMGGLVLNQVREAARAYSEWNVAAAYHVSDREGAVAGYAATINEDQFTLIARRQPVASDLRAINALAKCAAELERADVESRKIARTVLQQTGRPLRGTSADVRHLAQLAALLLRHSLEALDRLDDAVATEVIARDQELDAEYAGGLRRLITRAMEDPRSLEVAIEAAFVLKSLERIGDHARNIARQTKLIAPEAQRAARGSTVERSAADSDPTAPF